MPTSWIHRPFRWLFAGIGFLCKVAIAAWAALAIYYSNLPWPWVRLALSLAFGVFSIWALWLARTRRALLVFAGVFLCVLGWFLSLRPTHDRPWRPDVAVMPRAYIDGDRVRLTSVRDFDYHTAHDFTIRHEERDVSISHLTSIDFFVAYFLPPFVAHTFLSFNFDNAPPLCISIEKRLDVDTSFDAVASLFRQFELIYVVGDERDIVRLRTNFRHEDVYMYHIRTTPERARRLFRIYLHRINQLADRPEFYHLLSNNCTINIVRYARIAGKPKRIDLRHLLNGLIDSYLYSMGLIDTNLPFEELRPRSRINDAAQAADNAPDFPERIRAAIPPRESLTIPPLAVPHG